MPGGCACGTACDRSSAHASSSPRSDTTAELRRTCALSGRRQPSATISSSSAGRRTSRSSASSDGFSACRLCPNAVSTAAPIADSASGGTPWTRMSSMLTRSAPADARGQADARLEVGVAPGGRDAARDDEPALLEREADAGQAFGQGGRLRQRLQALAVDEEVRRAQAAATAAQAIRLAGLRGGQGGDARPVHRHVLDDGHAQIAVFDRELHATVREGEGHRRFRVGHRPLAPEEAVAGRRAGLVADLLVLLFAVLEHVRCSRRCASPPSPPRRRRASSRTARARPSPAPLRARAPACASRSRRGPVPSVP